LILAFVIEFLIFRYAPISSFLISILFVAGPAILFAFAKVNGQKFHTFLLHFLFTNRRPKLRVWNKNISESEAKFNIERTKQLGVHIEKEEKIIKKKLSTSRLAEISLIVDTGGVYKGEKQKNYEQTKRNNSEEN